MKALLIDTISTYISVNAIFVVALLVILILHREYAVKRIYQEYLFSVIELLVTYNLIGCIALINLNSDTMSTIRLFIFNIVYISICVLYLGINIHRCRRQRLSK